ncbi:MAG: DUF6677 family protein [Planctomycetota bacterium]
MNTKRPTLPAIFLGLLIPGAGHWYAGAAAAGMLWFAIITILTFTGYSLAGPAFAALYQTQMSPFGINITIPLAIPDAANFIESLIATKFYKNPHVDAPVPASAPFGYILAAFGGVLNVIAVADAHYRCVHGAVPQGYKSPAAAALLAFLIPGGGHYYLGRRGKALIAGIALTLTLVIGIVLAEGATIQRERDQYFWSGQILLGIPAAVATVVNHGRRIQHEMPLAELGLLFTTVAGLLNVLMILDAYSTAERDIVKSKETPEPATPAPAVTGAS